MDRSRLESSHKLLTDNDFSQAAEGEGVARVPAGQADGRAAAQRTGAWYEAHGRAVYNYFRFLGAPPDLAEEFTAETFLRAVKAAERFDERKASARTWLCRIAQNVWRDDLRRSRVRRHEPLASHRDLAADAPSPEERLLWEEQVTALLAAVRELSPGDQELIGLRYGSDLEHAAIAEMLGIGESAVRTRLWRALKKLREKLAP